MSCNPGSGCRFAVDHRTSHPDVELTPIVWPAYRRQVASCLDSRSGDLSCGHQMHERPLGLRLRVDLRFMTAETYRNTS